jgi:hypothetical protein
MAQNSRHLNGFEIKLAGTCRALMSNRTRFCRETATSTRECGPTASVDGDR